MTPQQQSLTERLQSLLEADPRIEALWLGGSLGRGAGDAFSDIDLIALVPEGQSAATGQAYVRDLGRSVPCVIARAQFGGGVMTAVTEDWDRFDISFVEPGGLGRFDPAQIRPLFNRGTQQPAPRELQAYQTAPETLDPMIEEFFRILGLLTLSLGRQDYLLGLSGIGFLRQMTLDLMLEENGIGPMDRGGALSRLPLLTPDQLAELDGLSTISADRDGIIRGNLDLARIFVPRARRLADRIDLAWPEALEAAVRRHLKRQLALVW